MIIYFVANKLTHRLRLMIDIRQPADDPFPPDYFVDFLNLASTQEALGVNINYTSPLSRTIFDSFEDTGNASTISTLREISVIYRDQPVMAEVLTMTAGDWVFDDFQDDLERIIDRGMATALLYGDADYICNWFGGEEISLQMNHSTSEEFRASNYTPFVVDGEEYGVVRQYGNYSFVRLYNSGHEAPYYQPKASLEHFRRLINGLVIADGSSPVTDDYQTPGTPNATHTEPYPPLPTNATAAGLGGTK